MVMPAFYLQKTLLLLPKLDYSLPIISYSNYNNVILNLPNSDFVNKNTSVLLQSSSGNKITINNGGSALKTSERETNLLFRYRASEFSGVMESKLNYSTLFSLDLMNYKAIISNVNNNLELAKQSK
jgi:hypothetical protein